jgi:hypothetical protein
MVGIAAVIIGKGKKKIAGADVVGVSVVVFLAMIITSVFFLGGVYSIQKGISDSGELLSKEHIVVGCILYIIGIFVQLIFTISNKKENK